MTMCNSLHLWMVTHRPQLRPYCPGVTELERLLAGGPVSVRDYRSFASSLSRMAAQGRVVAILPGVYVCAEAADDISVRASAVHRWDRDAVVCGAAAARLTFWPTLPVGKMHVAVRHARASRPGFAFERRRVPSEEICRINEIAMTSPALTAVDLAAHDDGAAIDEVLRRRLVTVGMLEQALEATSGRSGHAVRRRVVADSRTEPWSQAERLLHRLLREARLRGWRANVEVVARGRRYFIDVAFPSARVAVEVDGLAYHNAQTAQHDLERQNNLILEGWTVLRFTWGMLTERPDLVVQTIMAALG